MNTLSFSKEELDQEIWKLITWSNGTYYISNLGRVKKKYKNYERILKPYLKTNKRKYLYIKIFLDNNTKIQNNKRKYKQKMIHQLVAEFFLPVKPGIDYVLFHKNGVLTDNRDFNLTWITKKELGRITGGKTKRVKGILKIDPKTNKIINYYKTSREAGKANYCSYQTILDSCNRKNKKRINCTGFIFAWDTGNQKYKWS